jgi:23S rRNA pseudouridine2605 synthase
MSGGAADEKQAETRAEKGERIAKVIARSGICSRRDAERLIAEGRVTLNGRVLTTPATVVTAADRIVVNGEALPSRERTRLWLFHKPKGLVTTSRDPEGRPTVFQALPKDMPRVLSVGRLDINTEGLLLLTNDGGLARTLELPATGWLRRYRVRAHGEVEQAALDRLRHGVTIDGMVYGAVEAELDRVQGTNVWLIIGLREGKNREVKRVLEHLGLSVNRLIRISYGPFQLGDIAPGEVREVRGRVLRDQLGEKLSRAAHADFEAPLRQNEDEEPKRSKPARGGKPGERAKSGEREKAGRGEAPKRQRAAGPKAAEREERPGRTRRGPAKLEPAPEDRPQRQRPGAKPLRSREAAPEEARPPKRVRPRPKPTRGRDADRRRTP